MVSERVHTVVEAFEGGQFAGTALAEVLFGIVNPSGTLPYTIFTENSTNKLPFSAFQMRPNSTYYGRTYRFSTAKVLFPFGHGLSYTSFDLKWKQTSLSVSPLQIHEGVTFTAVVTNIGNVAGSRAVHAFVSNNISSVFASAAPTAPFKSLFGIEKVYLLPGE